jgi:hypothetical protein
MSLVEQMLSIDRLIRCPAALEVERAKEGDGDSLLSTVDGTRLQAVHKTFALLVVSRWWQARFPAVIASVSHFLGGPLKAATQLYSDPSFVAAVDEDVTGAALVGAVLALTEDDEQETPEWLGDLLAYEYLLSTGLPRRVRGEPLCEQTEARLLPNATWVEGGRLRSRVLLCPFDWPVSALQDEPYDAEPRPHSLLFVLSDDSALEVDAGDLLADAVELLGSGASDEVIAQALGDESAEVLAQLNELELLL